MAPRAPRSTKSPAVRAAPIAVAERLDAVYWPFVRWMARPVDASSPQDATQFALAHGVTLDELRSLSFRPSYPDDLRAAAIAWSAESLPVVLHKMYAQASGPQATIPEQQKYVEAVVSLRRAERDAPPSVAVNLFGMDDDRFARILSRAVKKSPAAVLVPDSRAHETSDPGVLDALSEGVFE